MLKYKLKLKDVKLEHLGIAKSIESTKGSTVIIDGSGDLDEVDKKIELLKKFEDSDLFKNVLDKFPDANLVDIISKKEQDK